MSPLYRRKRQKELLPTEVFWNPSPLTFKWFIQIINECTDKLLLWG